MRALLAFVLLAGCSGEGCNSFGRGFGLGPSFDHRRPVAAAAGDVCGDSLITGSEACDDGGTADGDGCSATCTIETGCACSGEPSVCICNLLSIQFDGTNESASSADNEEFECDTELEYTACFWYFATDRNTTQSFVVKLNTANALLVDSGANHVFRFGNFATCGASFAFADTTSTFSYGAWRHVCFWFDSDGAVLADRARVFVNSVSQTLSGSFNNTWPNCATTQYIAHNGTTQWYSENLDELYVWCEALTQTEIDCVYNGGDDVFNASSCATTSPRIWARFGDSPTDTNTLLENQGSGPDFTLTNVEAGDLVMETP